MASTRRSPEPLRLPLLHDRDRDAARARRWTGSRLGTRVAGRRHPRRARPRLRADRVRARPALYVGTGDAGERGAAQDTASLNGKLLALDAGAISRDRPRGPRSSLAASATPRASTGSPVRAGWWRPTRAERLRRAGGLRRGRRDRPRRQLRLAARPSATSTGGGPLHVHRCACTATRSRRPARRSSSRPARAGRATTCSPRCAARSCGAWSCADGRVVARPGHCCPGGTGACARSSRARTAASTCSRATATAAATRPRPTTGSCGYVLQAPRAAGVSQRPRGEPGGGFGGTADPPC